MDWNHDGKHDWKDDAFYNNVIAPENKDSSSFHSGSSGNKNSNNTNYSSSSSSNGWAWFIVICIFYFLIKLIGG